MNTKPNDWEHRRLRAHRRCLRDIRFLRTMVLELEQRFESPYIDDLERQVPDSAQSGDGDD